MNVLKVVVNHAPLTNSLTIIFTLVLRKKNIDRKRERKKEKDHLIHHRFILSPAFRPENFLTIQFENLYMNAIFLLCMEYKKSALLKVNYQKHIKILSFF